MSPEKEAEYVLLSIAQIYLSRAVYRTPEALQNRVVALEHGIAFCSIYLVG